ARSPRHRAAALRGGTELGEAAEQRLARRALLEEPAKRRVAKDEGDAREGLEVRLDGRAQEKEERVDAHAVERAEVHRVLEEAQQNRRLLDAQHERVARMRHGEAAADGGRREALARP